MGERERGLRRLRRWTTLAVVASSGLAGVLSLTAAGTFAGNQAAAQAGTQQNPSLGSSEDSPAESGALPAAGNQSGVAQPQVPAGGLAGGGTGRVGAVSGGS
ncbi:MAG: hypothetical protein M3024_14125 [Candidatus Dormibacteraeota bacterium]|nr:hypothetical protein [Candidatus Dormibacteraeota bacterium]